MSNFHVGQKVVCVNAKGGFRNLLGEIVDLHEITENAIYTIRWIGISNGVPVVKLRGVVRGRVPKPLRASNRGKDVPFASSRFRPLIERSTDISIFQQLLNPSPVLAKEPV